MFIDEGIFSLLDDIDDIEVSDVDESRRRESRENAERRLALAKLEEKPFETVRMDTIDQIRDGFIRGNLRSFRSPTSDASHSPRGFQPSHV